MTVIDWLLDSDPCDPLAGDARPGARAARTSSPPSGPGSRPRAGAPGCSHSRRRTAGGPAGLGRRTGRTRSTSWSSCGGSGSIPGASRPGGRSASSASTSSGAAARPVETPWADNRFFEGEVEPCINGNVVATGAYFGVDMTPLVERLLGEQLPDGGWNCEVENGATVSSFGTTINVLEGLLEHERAIGGSAEVRAARRRGEAYMLERRLFRRKSTGEVIDPSWLQFSFPTWYFYDVLRGLDYLRDAGSSPTSASPRRSGSSRAIADPDGRWPLQNVHEGEAHFEMDDGEGQPSRWNTLRALRVLDWARVTRPSRERPSPTAQQPAISPAGIGRGS